MRFEGRYYSFIIPDICVGPLQVTSTQRCSQPSYSQRRRTSERRKIWKGGPSARNAARRANHSMLMDPQWYILIIIIMLIARLLWECRWQRLPCLLHLERGAYFHRPTVSLRPGCASRDVQAMDSSSPWWSLRSSSPPTPSLSTWPLSWGRRPAMARSKMRSSQIWPLLSGQSAVTRPTCWKCCRRGSVENTMHWRQFLTWILSKQKQEGTKFCIIRKSIGLWPLAFQKDIELLSQSHSKWPWTNILNIMNMTL